MRIQEHPILGTYEKGELVSFTFDGKELQGYAGEPIAMALKNAGVMGHRYTKKKHEPRGIFLCHWTLYGLRHGGGWQAECAYLHHTFGGRDGCTHPIRR